MASFRANAREVDGVELVVMPGHTPPLMSVPDPDDQAWMLDRLAPHPWKTFEQPLTLENEEAVREIPRTIVNCTPSIAARVQRHQDRLFDGDRVWEIDTGHDLMITEPEQVAEMLDRLASV
jgi:hypothetical protein